jgi:hypothetical protein
VLKNGLCAIDVVGDSATKPTTAITAAIAQNIGSARLLIELAVAAAITRLRIFPSPDVSFKVESLSTTAVLVLL